AEINVFPNPMVGNNINITFTNVKNGAYDLQIVNMAGAVVKTMPIQHEGSKTYTVNLATQLPAGIYNVSVKDNSGKVVHTQQVVKQ
ncbi:MAG TPA: T9SS type A sorting domain-containing protein, partial [Flavipsychrobacter sp.]|nr:T9SS type A sorting domain-containing protein [Flavipsychrobacter sp.]